jgi:polysaccharide chain length determinant protein (PEP-CTERM system associated)
MLPGRQLSPEFALKLAFRNRWLLIAPLFLGSLGGLVYSRSLPSLYRSDAIVQVVPQRIPNTYVESTVTSRVEDRLTSITQQVLSRTQLEAVILESDLYREERAEKPMEDVYQLMSERVAVAPVQGRQPSSRDSSVDSFRISFDYHDPQIARDVVAKLAAFFIDRNATERGSQADQASSFLEAQLADARARLEAQEKRLEAFREQNAGRLPTQMQTNMQAIQNTQMALQAMVESLARDRDRKLLLERLYNDASADPPVSVPAPVTPPGNTPAATVAPPAGTPQQRLEAAKGVLARMETRLAAKHPDIVRAKSVIEELEREVAAADASNGKSPSAPTEASLSPEEARRRDRLREMRAEIESLARQVAFKEREEQRLRAEVTKYQALLEAVPGIESEWIALTRDYDTLNVSYRELLTKSENSKMAASLERRQIGEQFRILDAPRIPLKPHSPNRLKINAMGAAAGLGLGLLLTGLAVYRDSTMRSEADVVGAIDLPVLTAIPLVKTIADVRRRRLKVLLESAAVLGVFAVTGILVWYLQLWKFVA